MPVEELDGYFAEHEEEIKAQIRAKKYKPQPVRRQYTALLPRLDIS